MHTSHSPTHYNHTQSTANIGLDREPQYNMQENGQIYSDVNY
jgi:hypothetical protein